MKELQKQIGLKGHSTLSKWIHRKMPVTPEYAQKLEEVTGINRLCFLYPDEFGDPWERVCARYRMRWRKPKP